MTTLPGVSTRGVCRVLGFPRARLRARAALAAVPPRLDEALAGRIQQSIERHPTFGYRRLWGLLHFAQGIRVNRKAVYRVLKLKGWLVHQRTVTPRPRVQGLKSRAQRSDERWAMDLTHIPCGADGWGHLTAVIDCHDREVTGYEFALRGRAKEAERALEEACRARFGTLRPDGATPVVRSDNGLIFQSGVFAPPAATIGCARSSSLPTRPSSKQTLLVRASHFTVQTEGRRGCAIPGRATLYKDGVLVGRSRVRQRVWNPFSGGAQHPTIQHCGFPPHPENEFRIRGAR
jgi:putative transposase